MRVGGLGRCRSGRGDRNERLLLLRRHHLVVGLVRLDGVVQLRGAPLERLDARAVRPLELLPVRLPRRLLLLLLLSHRLDARGEQLDLVLERLRRLPARPLEVDQLLLLLLGLLPQVIALGRQLLQLELPIEQRLRLKPRLGLVGRANNAARHRLLPHLGHSLLVVLVLRLELRLDRHVLLDEGVLLRHPLVLLLHLLMQLLQLDGQLLGLLGARELRCHLRARLGELLLLLGELGKRHLNAAASRARELPARLLLNAAAAAHRVGHQRVGRELLRVDRHLLDDLLGALGEAQRRDALDDAVRLGPQRHQQRRLAVTTERLLQDARQLRVAVRHVVDVSCR